MIPVRTPAVVGALALGLAATPALAQTSITRSVQVQSGKEVRLAIAPNLKKDCSTGPMPEVKVTSAPKNGALITKAGKAKTSATYRCPNKEAGVQGVFYQPNAKFTGADEVVFEIKTSDGQTDVITVKIAVGAASSTTAKPTGTDL